MEKPDEHPWRLTADHLLGLPSGIQVLQSPAGLNHLAFDTGSGQWLRLHADGRQTQIDPGQAIRLRPHDINLIIMMTMVWALGEGRTKATLDAVDQIADTAKMLLVHYAGRAGGRS